MTDRPVFNQLNLVVRDMAAMVEFYERLGIDFTATFAPWDENHRTVSPESVLDGFDFDLDSQAFASVWDEGWPAGQIGPVLGFQLSTAAAVDETYERLTSAGYAAQKPPTDEFMGARYAIVVDPDGNSVGLMGPIDPSKKRMPPTPGS